MRRRLFGTSGIRGEANVRITPELALKVGLSFATLLGNEGTVIVGRDARPSAPMVENAVLSGLMAGGLDVVECGTAPTPAVVRAVKRLGLDGGVMVTGSHTAPRFIGMMFFLSRGIELAGEGEGRMERICVEERYRRVPWDRVGTLRRQGVLDLYHEEVTGSVDADAIADGGFRVVVDPGNGLQALALPRILASVGCGVVAINSEVDGTFPARRPDPRPETVRDLSEVVRASGADLGVATDGDGDRALFVTEEGEVLWGDVTGCLFAAEELEKRGGGAVVCPINTSSLIEEVCDRHGGRVVYTKVGPPQIIRGVTSTADVAFAFEETGKYIWPEAVCYGDPALATCRLLEIMAREGRSLAEMVGGFPAYHRFKRSVPCPDERKGAVLERVMGRMRGTVKGVRVDLTDGVKAVWPDGSWLLLRPSGTEPVFRCFSESKDEGRARELLETGLRLIRSAL